MNYPFFEWVGYPTPNQQKLIEHLAHNAYLNTNVYVRQKVWLTGQPWGVQIGNGPWIGGNFGTVDEAKQFAEATYELGKV